MLLCPNCHDSQWTVEATDIENIVICRTVITIQPTGPLAMLSDCHELKTECGTSFSLPLWVCFPPTTRKKIFTRG